MVRNILKLFVGSASVAAIVWLVSMGGGLRLLAVLVALTGAALYWLLSLSGSRDGSELLRDPAASTLVFPPESRLH